MKSQNLIAPLLTAMLIVSCSHAPTTPTTVAESKGRVSSPAWDAGVQATAAGDTKVGPIDIDLNLLRFAQAVGGVPAFYAAAGGVYGARPNLEIEIYAQIWTSSSAITNARFIVDWGNGERDSTGCGSCRLSRTYKTEGTYRVTVTLDDRVSSTTSRTFTLNVAAAPPQREGFGTFGGVLSTTDLTGPSTFDGVPFAPPTSSPGTCSVLVLAPFYTDLFTVVHEGGPMQIQVTSSAFTPFVGVFKGGFNISSPCANIVSMNTTQANYPPGIYVIALTSFGVGSTGAYTISIQ